MVIKSENIHDNFKTLYKMFGTTRPQLEGSFIEGTIVAKNKHLLTIHTGLKTSTQFIDKELHLSYNEKEQTVVGLKTQLYLHNIENMDGDLVYNPHYYTQKIKSVTAWNRVNKLKYVKGVVLNTVNGGFSVGIGGFVAFLPRSRAKLPTMGKRDYILSLMNNYRLYRIIKINPLRKNIVVSLVNNSNTYTKKGNNS